MPGRPDFSQPGTVGSGQTVAVTERPEIVTVDASQTGSVSAGVTETTEVYAPIGAVYRVVGAKMRVPSDATATTGDHRIFLASGGVESVEGVSAYSSEVFWNHYEWQTADIRARPSNETSKLTALQSLKATENTPMKVKYHNNTDAAQDNDRSYTFVVEEVSY